MVAGYGTAINRRKLEARWARREARPTPTGPRRRQEMAGCGRRRPDSGGPAAFPLRVVTPGTARPPRRFVAIHAFVGHGQQFVEGLAVFAETRRPGADRQGHRDARARFEWERGDRSLQVADPPRLALAVA